MSERILLVSDTHGRLNYFKEMLARTGKPDRLIHLGDSEGQQDEIARLLCAETVIIHLILRRIS